MSISIQSIAIRNKELFCQECFSVLRLIKVDAKVYYLIAAIVISNSFFISLNGFDNNLRWFAYMYAMQWVVFFSFAIAFVGYFLILIIRRESRPLLCYRNKLIDVWEFRANILSAFILLTAMSAFISSFSTMKSLIPIVHPFAYDQLFYDIDLWLFGGKEPWRMIHIIVDSPTCMMLVNIAYKLWFLLIWAVLAYFLLASDKKARHQYLISWVLCWFLLGTVLAMLLSSAGPAFVERLEFSSTRYSELMRQLEHHHQWLVSNELVGIWALNTQDELWSAYYNGKEMLGSGISAMPSMHVSMSVLMAMGCWTLNRWVGVFMWLFAGVIYVGSVTLGWHYAIDGLVSLPLTVFIWKLVGRYSRA